MLVDLAQKMFLHLFLLVDILNHINLIITLIQLHVYVNVNSYNCTLVTITNS